MSYAAAQDFASRRPYGRPVTGRPINTGTYVPAPTGGFASTAGAGALGGALGALGGTLGCLLCLAAIGALGLFSCVVAITAYTKQFLDRYKTYIGINGAEQLHLGAIVLFASLFYTIVCRMQRS